MEGASQTSICPVCHHRVRLFKNGKLANHGWKCHFDNTFITGFRRGLGYKIDYYTRGRCCGSGKPVK